MEKQGGLAVLIWGSLGELTHSYVSAGGGIKKGTTNEDLMPADVQLSI